MLNQSNSYGSGLLQVIIEEVKLEEKARGTRTLREKDAKPVKKSK